MFILIKINVSGEQINNGQRVVEKRKSRTLQIGTSSLHLGHPKCHQGHRGKGLLAELVQ